MTPNISPFAAFGLTSIALGFLMISGCEDQEGSPIDLSGTPPLLSNGALSPDTVNIDDLSAVNSLYTIQSSARVKAMDADGDIAIVVARVLRRNSSSTLLEIPLHDDGTGEDSLANDAIFSGLIEFQIPRSDAGAYRIEYLANDASTYLSNLVGVTLLTTRRNAPPSMDGVSLVAPDTVTIPVGGSIQIPMSIAAQDSDGIADIRSVFFLSPDGTNPTFRFPLKDDGGAEVGPPSGDLAAGDGIFSIILSISDSPSIRGNYRLLFQAEDTFGDTSSAVLHLLTIE